MSESNKQRTVLVTGGTGALGQAVVCRFLEMGARVHTTWLRERETERLCETSESQRDRMFLHQADVTSETGVKALIREIADLSGGVDVLANIVGGFVFAPVNETDGGMWNRMMATNATSAFLCSRAAVSGMRERGWGRIVNVASAPALGRGAANMSAYAASKAAVLNLTYSLSEELMSDGITVNAIVPSVINTPANQQAMPNADTSTWLPPLQIADVIVFLASEAAGIVTGTAVNLAIAGRS